MWTARLVGPWDEVERILNGLPSAMQRAGMAAIREEGEHLRADMVAGVTSGAPGGYPFAPLSPLTRLLHGNSQPMLRSRQLLAAIVMVDAAGGVFVGIRGERLRLAALHDAGATYHRTLTARQRRWFFGALRRAGLEPNPGMGGGVVHLPPRPIVGPVMARAFGGGFAMNDRIRKSFARHMGGVLGSA